MGAAAGAGARLYALASAGRSRPAFFSAAGSACAARPSSAAGLACRAHGSALNTVLHALQVLRAWTSETGDHGPPCPTCFDRRQTIPASKDIARLLSSTGHRREKKRTCRTVAGESRLATTGCPEKCSMGSADITASSARDAGLYPAAAAQVCANTTIATSALQQPSMVATTLSVAICIAASFSKQNTLSQCGSARFPDNHPLTTPQLQDAQRLHIMMVRSAPEGRRWQRRQAGGQGRRGRRLMRRRPDQAQRPLALPSCGCRRPAGRPRGAPAGGGQARCPAGRGAPPEQAPPPRQAPGRAPPLQAHYPHHHQQSPGLLL